MSKYKFELEQDTPATYRLVQTGWLWDKPKDVFLTKNNSGNTYVCSAEYCGKSASSRMMSDTNSDKLGKLMKKQGLKNRKALMEAKFPQGTDQRAIDCWALILNCISLSEKKN